MNGQVNTRIFWKNSGGRELYERKGSSAGLETHLVWKREKPKEQLRCKRTKRVNKGSARCG